MSLISDVIFGQSLLVLTDALDFLVGDHLAAACRPALRAHLSREVLGWFWLPVLRQCSRPSLHVCRQEDIEAFKARQKIVV